MSIFKPYMQQKLDNIRKHCLLIKIYFTRAMTYVSVINFCMIIFLTISDLKRYNIDINLKIYLVPIFIVLLFVVLLIGYIDDKLFIRKELGLFCDRNPYFVNILKKLNSIEERLNKINEK